MCSWSIVERSLRLVLLRSGSGCSSLRVRALLVFLFLASGLIGNVQAKPCEVFSATGENDTFGTGRDDNYTHGMQFSCASSAFPNLPFSDWADRTFRNRLERLSGRLRPAEQAEDSASVHYRHVLRVGQKMFTPRDLSRRDLVEDDRPYAGWLYLGWGVMREARVSADLSHLDSLEVDLGIVGPASGASHVQRWWHGRLNAVDPRGWHNQLRNEPGLMIRYDRRWRISLSDKVDITPHAGVALGNVYTFGSLGGSLRFGYGLDRDYGAPRIRPGTSGVDYFTRGRARGFSAYGFVGLEGRGVVRNIFLDGNSFKDSHDVDKYPGLGEAHAGVVASTDAWRFSFSVVYRTKEFEQQPEAATFAMLNLAYAFR